MDDMSEQIEGLHLLFIDGSKDANDPTTKKGKASIDVRLMDPSGRTEIDRISESIASVSQPHEAEYRALLAGLQLALNQSPPLQYVAVFSDSRTVVNQVNGNWKSRGPLGKLRAEVIEMFKRFPPTGVQVSWIPREWNEAHKLASDGRKNH